MRRLYDFMYRYRIAPFDLGVPHSLVVDLVDQGVLTPCRVLLMACGPGSNAIFLAQRGFEVTAFDFSPEAIRLAKERAAERGVQGIRWLVDDATTMTHIEGPFDLIMDCGSLSDLTQAERTAVYTRMHKLLHPQTRFFSWGFEWEPAWYERWFYPKGRMSFDVDEIRERFSTRWTIETIDRREGGPFVGFGCYLLTQRDPASGSGPPAAG